MASDRLDLKRLIQHQGDDYQDNTDGIRRLKHSSLILADVMKMEKLKKTMASKRKTRNQDFVAACQLKCSFLFNKYTDIFNRLIKDELDLELLSQMLATLQKIEDGTLDQQEGSVVVGKILHKIYVESALSRSRKIDEARCTEEEGEEKEVGKDISWTEYKNKKLI
jgi:hypothetical protein